MATLLRHYTFSLAFTAVCFGLAIWYGWASTQSVSATLSLLWIVVVLSILEVSLSFDNAVVNATVLREMDPVWQQRFLTWGILIAVFGMRIVFPLLIVVIAANIGPWQAVVLASVGFALLFRARRKELPWIIGAGATGFLTARGAAALYAGRPGVLAMDAPAISAFAGALIDRM